MAYQKYSKKKLLNAIKKSGGFKSEIYRRLGCCRQTLDNYLKADPELQEALKNEKEDLQDLAEAKLLEKVKNGDLGAIIFYLKTQGKGRGYTEKHDFTGTADIILRVDKDDEKL